jgi:hypothetical protein
MLLLLPTHNAWSVFLLIPLVVLGFLGALGLIFSGLRGILGRHH